MSDLERYSFLEDSHNDCYCDMIPDSKGNWVDAEAAHKRIAELEAKNKWLVELLKTSVAEFDDGIKYPLEVVNDLKQVLASMEPRKLTGYESEALDKALRASSKLVGKGMEKDDGR